LQGSGLVTNSSGTAATLTLMPLQGANNTFSGPRVGRGWGRRRWFRRMVCSLLRACWRRRR
jgi:hypothetical protein